MIELANITTKPTAHKGFESERQKKYKKHIHSIDQHECIQN